MQQRAETLWIYVHKNRGEAVWRNTKRACCPFQRRSAFYRLRVAHWCIGWLQTPPAQEHCCTARNAEQIKKLLQSPSSPESSWKKVIQVWRACLGKIIQVLYMRFSLAALKAEWRSPELSQSDGVFAHHRASQTPTFLMLLFFNSLQIKEGRVGPEAWLSAAVVICSVPSLTSSLPTGMRRSFSSRLDWHLQTQAEDNGALNQAGEPCEGAPAEPTWQHKSGKQGNYFYLSISSGISILEGWRPAHRPLRLTPARRSSSSDSLAVWSKTLQGW